jgi:hypothetical protein
MTKRVLIEKYPKMCTILVTNKDKNHLAVVDRWSLFGGHLWDKMSKLDLKMAVLIDRWSIFGSGLTVIDRYHKSKSTNFENFLFRIFSSFEATLNFRNNAYYYFFVDR